MSLEVLRKYADFFELAPSSLLWFIEDIDGHAHGNAEGEIWKFESDVETLRLVHRWRKKTRKIRSKK